MLSPSLRPTHAIAVLVVLTVFLQTQAFCLESRGRTETIASFNYILDSTQLSPVDTNGQATVTSLAPATMTTFRQPNGPTRFVMSFSVRHDFDHTNLGVAVIDGGNEILDVLQKTTHIVKVGDRILVTLVGAFPNEHVGADRIWVLRALTKP